MKLTKERLKDIIREELKEVNLYHKADGTWGKKKTGNVRSISQKAADRNNVDQSYVGKSIVAQDTDKVRKKYGMERCGKQTVSGSPITPTYSCKDTPKRYYQKKNEELMEDELLNDGDEEVSRAYQRGSVDLAVKKALKGEQEHQPCDLNAILRFLDLMKKAESGKLNEPSSAK